MPFSSICVNNLAGLSLKLDLDLYFDGRQRRLIILAHCSMRHAPMGNAVKHFRALYKACERKMVTRRVSEGCTSAGAESQFIPR